MWLWIKYYLFVFQIIHVSKLFIIKTFIVPILHGILKINFS